jgi:ABC-2 type transport system permease protein
VTRAWDQLRAVVRRDFLTDVRYRVAFVMSLADAGVVLVSYSFLAGVFGDRRPDGYAALPFLLVGIAMTDSMTTALVSFALGARSSQQPGTVKALLALPISTARLMLISMAYPFLRGAIDFVIFLSAGCALGMSCGQINAAPTIVTFVLAIASVGVLGLASSAFALVFKRGDPVLWVVGTLTWLLSGVLYPTTVLPQWLQAASLALPATHALAAMRAAVIDGASWAAMAPDLAALAVFDLVGIPLGLWGYARAAAHARRAGTLGHA